MSDTQKLEDLLNRIQKLEQELLIERKHKREYLERRNSLKPRLTWQLAKSALKIALNVGGAAREKFNQEAAEEILAFLGISFLIHPDYGWVANNLMLTNIREILSRLEYRLETLEKKRE